MKKIIFIVGPTAVGKSAEAFALAKSANGEIVSADAMQVYKEVNIACDKPTPAMQAQVKHHLIDIVSVREEFDVARFRELAVAAINDIHARGKLPIVVGGSGMYVTVLLDGIFNQEASNQELRDQLLTRDVNDLYVQLKGLDPAAAAKIHHNDLRRMVRALEVVLITGKPISQLQKTREGLWGNYDIEIIGLNRPREILYARAEQRIDQMIANGLIDEVKILIPMQLSKTSATLIGIPEIMGYISGEYDLEYAKYLLKRNTRHFIKRQLTWFRRDERILWKELGAK